MKNNSLVISCLLRTVRSLALVASAAALGCALASAQAPCPPDNDQNTAGCAPQPTLPAPAEDTPSPAPGAERRQDGTQPSQPGDQQDANSDDSTGNTGLMNGDRYQVGSRSRQADSAQETSSTGRKPLQTPTEPRLAAPEPPTEFQNFVYATTGVKVPIYGARYFARLPTPFGPIDHGPAPGTLILGADDQLRIRVWGQVNFSANPRVSRAGEIYLPKVGAVHVAGLPFSELAGHLRSAMERVYRNFELSVDIGEVHTIQIYAAGMARRPGEYTVGALNTLVDAVFVAGGPSSAGSMRHAQLKRDGRVIADFDLYAFLGKGDKSGDVQLQPGDVIYIPPTGPQMALIGSVRQAGIYELRDHETVKDLLEMAGGLTAAASGASLSLDRIEDHARRRAFNLGTDPAGLATVLADGDILRADPVLSVYSESVTLRGAVANPGHFFWHAGMHLSELLPERDALLKRDYWWARTKLGLPAPQLVPLPVAEKMPEPVSPVQSPLSQTNWNRAVIERLDTTTMTTSLLSFDLGKLVLEHDATQDLELKPNDVVTIFAQNDIHIPIHEQTVYVELAGEFKHPGVYSVTNQESLRSLVERAGGLTQQAYVDGAVFTRKSTQALEQARLKDLADQLDHQLARDAIKAAGSPNGNATQEAIALNRQMIERLRTVKTTGRVVLNLNANPNGYNLPDMHLEDGDRLEVPFVPETVQVFGAVFNPHAFLFHKDGRVEEYLRLAGGVTREADRKKLFVIRADGSVVGRENGQLAFGKGLAVLRLHPGDSIVVPERTLRPSAVSSALAWASAVSGTAINAMEVNALK